ncbi:unnamed protein product [Phytophthora fragariaefolia]|uniref:Unnamed protein product n=1 Tax=Phytophthora fragariaefolia TaxID=1490495 RepID=A0A9W7D6X1_9STRA|nr:unnamed protein product [Phytophthora fragariaefolia]
MSSITMAVLDLKPPINFSYVSNTVIRLVGGSAGSTVSALKLRHFSALNLKHGHVSIQYRDRSQLEPGDRSEIETGTALGYIWLGSPVIGTLTHSDHISVGHYTTTAPDVIRAELVSVTV